MNFNPICVYDYETAARNRFNCQVIQIAAVMIHSRKLEIVDKFVMTVRPDWDAEGCDPQTIEWHAQQRGITTKQMTDKLNDAPDITVAWPTFVSWVDQYNFGKPAPSSYKAPISAGYNIAGFDNVITDRYCEKYGPTQKDKYVEGLMNPRLFNGVYHFDLMQHLWFWFENVPVGSNEELNNLQLPTIAQYMGIPEEVYSGAHDAYIDVYMTAQIILKLFKMERYMTAFKTNQGDDEEPRRRLQMKNCFLDSFPMP